MYLIRFTYDHYCQGYEDATEIVLVYAQDFGYACNKIMHRYKNARGFENLTLK
jgi:hypothetical protein